MSTGNYNDENYRSIPVVKNESREEANSRMIFMFLCILMFFMLTCFPDNKQYRTQYMKPGRKEHFNFINKSINNEKYVTNKWVLGKVIKITNKTGDIPVKKINIITDKNIIYSYDLATETHRRVTDAVDIRFDKEDDGITISVEFPTEIKISEIIVDSDMVDSRAANLEFTKVYIRDVAGKITWETKDFLKRQRHNSLRVYEDRIVYQVNIDQPVENMPKYVNSHVETDPAKYDDEDRMFHLIH